jgi:hypothetical protein
MLEAIAAAIDGTPFALWAARDPLAYPVANVVHVLGLALFLGPIAILDLRLLGAFPALPLPALTRALTPLALAGLALLLLSGPILFAADAAALAQSATFRWKLLLLGAALLNAAAFRLLWHRRLLSGAPLAPPAAGMALASLAAWTAVAILGRWIAYAA